MVNTIDSNNKRIAKNTFFLYVRMIVVMIVSFYSSRVTLEVLGVSDFGVKNVVGSIVDFTVIITGTMVQATQRFLAYDLGKKDIESFKRTFSMMINIFIVFSIISIVLLEIIGPYMISYVLVIPPERIVAAQWFFQFVIINFVMNTMMIPYTAAIVAHERMGVYAYFTILDVILKLLVIFALYVIPFDKLILLGGLTVFVISINNSILLVYCKKKLDGCNYIRYWDRNFYLKLSSYAGWSLLGSTNTVMMSQGQAILLNLFFGPLINAAKAIADKIRVTIYHFVTNFYMAVSPQIIKAYSVGDIDYMQKLVLNTSKYAYFLLLVLTFPVINDMRSILILWLGEAQVTDAMVVFSKISLLFCLIQVLECPITKAVQATGNVKKYEIVVGFITLSFIPICYVVFRMGAEAPFSMILLCIVFFIAHMYRIYYVRNIIEIGFWLYIRRVLCPILLVTIFAICVFYLLPKPNSKDILSFVIRLFMSISILLFSIYLFGVTKSEKMKIFGYVKKHLKK